MNFKGGFIIMEIQRNENLNEEVLTPEVVENSGVIVVNNTRELSVDLSDTHKSNYSSIKGGTREEKAKLYKAKSSPDKKLSDCINQKLYAKDVYMEVVNITDEETGEVRECPRIVLIDKDGISYSCVSFGIYNSLKSLVGVFGEPTWDEPIPVVVRQKMTGKNRKQLVLDVEL